MIRSALLLSLLLASAASAKFHITGQVPAPGETLEEWCRDYPAVTRPGPDKSCVEQYRQLTAEQLERSKRDADRAAVKAEVKAARTDPDRVLVVWSAFACTATDGRAAALHQVKEEKNAERIAGVVDLDLLHYWQNEAYSFGKDLARARAAFRDLHRKPLKCDDAEVNLLLLCASPKEAASWPECSSLPAKALVELLVDVQAMQQHTFTDAEP